MDVIASITMPVATTAAAIARPRAEPLTEEQGADEGVDDDAGLAQRGDRCGGAAGLCNQHEPVGRERHQPAAEADEKDRP